jgi:hypothetical protein
VTAWGSASNPHVLAGEARRWTASIVGTIVLGSACAALLKVLGGYSTDRDRHILQTFFAALRCNNNLGPIGFGFFGILRKYRGGDRQCTTERQCRCCLL